MAYFQHPTIRAPLSFGEHKKDSAHLWGEGGTKVFLQKRETRKVPPLREERKLRVDGGGKREREALRESSNGRST